MVVVPALPLKVPATVAAKAPVAVEPVVPDAPVLPRLVVPPIVPPVVVPPAVDVLPVVPVLVVVCAAAGNAKSEPTNTAIEIRRVWTMTLTACDRRIRRSGVSALPDENLNPIHRPS